MESKRSKGPDHVCSFFVCAREACDLINLPLYRKEGSLLVRVSLSKAAERFLSATYVCSVGGDDVSGGKTKVRQRKEY